MSRHKFVRNMDFGAELDDYDYGDEEDGGMTEEEKQQMATALKAVRELLGDESEAIVLDKDIEESLWYYYFDVAKTVDYVLNTHMNTIAKKGKKGKKKKGSAVGQGLGLASSPEGWSSATEHGLFVDCPWGRVPEDRKGELVEMPVVRITRGLLGGSGKSSKLAELARKRKEKAAAAAAAGGSGEKKTSIVILSRLSQKVETATGNTLLLPPPSLPQREEMPTPAPPPPMLSEEKTPTSDLDHPRAKNKTEDAPTSTLIPMPSVFIQKEPLVASPSSFARSIFGERITLRHEMGFADGYLFYLSGNKEASGKPDPFAEPSPDDIVVAAQSASKGLNKGKPAARETAKVEEDLKALTIDHTPVKKVEKIDVLMAHRESNAKDNVNFVVVGHVDAGKSTLMGRMLYDSGAVSERAMRKIRQESEQIGKGSFALAWVMDQTEEERSRGVTIDIATNHFETEKTSFTILDAPGHRDFIPNMIAGASQADFAVLVIDASTGAFEAGFHRQGQTKEHTLLVRSIGVQRVVVAVNKMDTVGWSEARFEEIVQQMQQFLMNASFNMKNVTFVPLSGLSGANVVKKPAEGDIPWYKGQTLLEVLETSNTQTRTIEQPLRLVISDVFRGGVQNPVSISGRIDAGFLQEGDILVSIPSREQATIKGVTINDEPRKWAVAGHNVAVHLSGIDPTHLRVGDVLCSPSTPLHPLSVFTVKLLAFEGLTPMAVDVHKGRLHAAGKISAMMETLDKANGQVVKKKPRHVPPGAFARVQVQLVVGGETIPVEKGNRVVLRSNGVSVAAGIVE